MLRKLAALIAFFSCFSFAVYAVDVSAKSAVLYEPESGKVLYQKDMHSRREIASTTKIMTALLTLENADLNEVVYIKPEYTGAEGTSIYLKPGEKITVNTLMHGLMLQSGNDAAVALANHISGSEDAFVSLMNLKAAQLGMKNTNFENPNGLPADTHYSTAYDMALLTAYAMRNTSFAEIVSKTSYQGEGRTFVNHNKLLRMSDRVDGVKTGFTKKAGRCLVSSAVEDGMRLIAVTLSAPDDWNDHLSLYNYGFSNYRKHVYFKKDEALSKIPVISGKTKYVSTGVLDDIYTVESKNNAPNAHVEVFLPRFVYAPVKKDQKIGEARLVSNGEILSKSDIVSMDDSDIIEIKSLSDKIKDFFANLF